MATRPRRRLLHTSDVHLGAYEPKSPGARTNMDEAFARVIDLGLREEVDLLLIAGDFFDNARVKTDTFEFAAGEMARLGRPVVIGPGNHDHAGRGSVYDRYAEVAGMGDVRILRDPEGQTICLEDLDIEVWGRPHADHIGQFTPFANPPPRGTASWQIGVGHGHFIHPAALLHHSFHIREEHLAATNRDYVALGHWEHMTRVASGDHVIAAYSGAPVGMGGFAGGYAMIVDLLEDGRVQLTAHSLGGEVPISHQDIPFLRGL